jgi:Na+-driven multidrug efflux pump
VLTSDLAGRGRPEVGAWFSLIVVSINLPLDLLLIPHWGIVGAALASSVAYVTAGAAVLYLFSKASGLSVWRILVVQPSDWRQWLSWFDSGRLRSRIALDRVSE